MKTNNRFLYLDSVGGLLLIYMIVGHCCQWANVWESFDKYTYWLGFFMPWFFFKGGMFYRRRTLKDELRGGYKRLIVPYICFSIIGTIILWIKLSIVGELSIRVVLNTIKSLFLAGSVPGNLALWFLPSLFLVRIIFCYSFNIFTSHINKIRKYLWGGAFTIICLIFIPIHYIYNESEIKIPLYFFNISSGLTFYTCGFLLKDFRPQVNLTLILLTIYALCATFIPVSVDMRSGNLIRGEFLLWIPYSLIGIVSANATSRYIGNDKNLLESIGRDTMPYYCLHWCIIIMVSIFFYNKYGNQDYEFLIALLLSNIVLLPLLTNIIYKTRLKMIFG